MRRIGALDHSIVGSIVGELSLFLHFLFAVDNDRSAVLGSMRYMPLSSFPATLQEDAEVMEHFPFRNVVLYPHKSNWLIDRRECRKVGVWRAST